MPEQPPVIGGRYRLERALGEGGMGVVWLGHDEVLGRTVAVKRAGVLPGESADDRRRAMREARTAAALNHRHAVSVFDVVEHEGAPWLVMEYLDSRTLADLIADHPMPAERAARIGAHVAAALAAAHAAGIVHRDVKPANILVGDDDEAKISDFGIAHLVRDERLTRTGLVSGTPSYFSPEMARGQADPGQASDVWALGATLYAAVEGHPPHPRQDNVLAMLQVIGSEPVPPPLRAGLLTEPLARMLDPDPDERWTMAQAASGLEDLSRRRDTSTVPAPPLTREVPRRTTPTPPAPHAQPAEPAEPAQPAPSSDSPATRPATRSRLLPVALGAAVALLAVIGVLVAVTLYDPGPEAPSTADPDPDRSSTSGPSGSGDPSPAEGAEEPTPDESTPEEPTPEEPTEATSAPTTPVTGTPVETVDNYYDLVPDELDAAWSMLAPAMQERIGRGNFDGFWATISDVDATEVRAADGGTVTARIAYTRTDGSTSVENQVFTLVPEGDGFLIASDR